MSTASSVESVLFFLHVLKLISLEVVREKSGSGCGEGKGGRKMSIQDRHVYSV